jgi:two-component system NtrC family sensor kinase
MRYLTDPLYFSSPLIALAVTILLLILVLYKGRRGTATWIFLLLLISVALWNLLVFGMRTSADEYRALPWGRGISVPGFAVWVFFYHFSLNYTGTKRQKAILLIAYLLLALVVGLAPTDLLVERLTVEEYGYASETGPIGLLFFLFGFVLIVLAVVNLARCYRKSTSYEERNRLLYLSAAAIFPVIGGGLDGFSDLPPAAMWANLIFCIICSVAIIRYHLLDIKVVFRKGLGYLLISSIIAVPYVILLVIASVFLGATINSWWIYGLTIIILAAILRPIYDWAQQIIDRLFYRDRYDYLKALEQFSYQAQSVPNLEELGSKMVQLVSGAIRTGSACLLLQDEKKRGFTAAYCSGLRTKLGGVMIRNDSPIVKWLQSRREILAIERFDLVPQLQSISLRERNNIERMEANLFVPIGADKERLTGIIVLGEKLSQQPYSWEDRQLLATVSNQMFMAVENARLYVQTKQSEKVLRESEEKLRLMYESMVEGIIVTDLGGRILQVNEAAVHMYGCKDKDKLIKRNIIELVDTADRSKVENNLQAALRGEKTKCVEATFLNCKVGKFPGELNISVFRDAEGKPTGFVTVTEDITERKQAEEREKRLQAELNLSSRLASVGELAAGVAHEINNPLTGIMGFSQRLLRKSTDETSKRDLTRIFNETQRAARVVENLRTFARRSTPRKEKINIHDVLNKSIEMRVYELKTSNIELVADLPSVIPAVVADFHQIQQVFLNILINAEQAIKEAQKGSKITIKTQHTGKFVQISFADDGPGISEQNVDKIFDPFFTTRGEKGGTGLGLSICHGIITDHGGRIYIRSRPGKGTTFFVELPVT